jgi:23S rRNA (cytidine2498-2'-O)-methyltransferase
VTRNEEPSSEFCYVLCQRGAERALKHELSRTRPSLRPAYQRPGLITFKSNVQLTVDHELHAVLARTCGLSLGTVADVEAACVRIAELPSPLRLHVIEAELFRPDEAPPQHVAGQLAAKIDTALRAAMPNTFHVSEVAEPDELVLDVIVAPGDPMLLGLHRHSSALSPHPGGQYIYEVPDNSPSRAYRKIEEAIAAFALPMRSGDTALELGAAPGGAAYALARRGLNVIAVDPAEMDMKVLAFRGPDGAGVKHLRKPMNEVDENLLPSKVQWLLMDVHLAPQVALRAVSRFTSLYKKSLLGMVFTLKLNEWSFLDEVDRFMDAAQVMGMVTPRVKQLPAHRQEVVLAGLTKLGNERAKK